MRDGVVNSMEVRWFPFGKGWVRGDLEQLSLKVIINGTWTPSYIVLYGHVKMKQELKEGIKERTKKKKKLTNDHVVLEVPNGKKSLEA